MLKKPLVIVALLGIVFFSGCGNNNDGAGNPHLKVVLVDAPADYEAVNVDIQSIEAKFGDGSGDQWKDISIFEPATVNLLELVNGSAALLADTDVPAGNLSEIRLVLGSDNTLVVDGNTEDLTVPSGSTSGLKIKLDAQLLAGVSYTLILDFDAAKSIVATGSGKYNLKPVIHAKMQALTGAISGTVDPSTISAVAYAIQVDDTVTSSYTDETGGFLLQALEAGIYTVAIDSEAGSSTTDNVEVTVGTVNNIGTISFQQP